MKLIKHRFSQAAMAAALALPLAAHAQSEPAAQAAASGCDIMTTSAQQQALLSAAEPFKNPPVYDFTAAPIVADLKVEFKNPVLAGCTTTLRNYGGAKNDGRAVGPTMLIKPGQLYQADINNQLPDDETDSHHVRMMGDEPFYKMMGGHGGNSTMFGYVAPAMTQVNHNIPGDFNVTNLHTHGWHVSPILNHDNIFAAIGPGDPVYRQQIALPQDHVAGTFWYHAHLHGATAIQVASGMAGALIVVDPTKGLDAIPQIASAKDQIFVLQQLAYNEQGIVNEDYSNLQQGGATKVGYSSLNRPIFINGQAYPVINVTVNEVQRWRFIHAGITNSIKPQLVAVNGGTVLPMFEIALDGLPTGTMVPSQSATLAPGYRVDVLAYFVNTQVGQQFWLIDSTQQPTTTIYDGSENGKTVQNMRYILAQIAVVAGSAGSTTLPTAQQIAQAKADYVYGSYNPGSTDPYKGVGPLNDVTDSEITGKLQTVHYLKTDQYQCPEMGGSCTPCLDANNQLITCTPSVNVFMTCDGKDSNNNWSCINFNNSAEFARTLALNSASKWQVSGDTGQANHTFHIHVNPFQVQRKNVDGSTGNLGDQWVWKDTLRTPAAANAGDPLPIATLKSRYVNFTGAFVQHCHVLHHEDRGMMQVVEIAPSAQEIMRMLDSMDDGDAKKMIMQQIRQ